MSFHLQSDIPVWHELTVLFGPDSIQVGESGLIDDARYGAIHALPEFGKRRIRPSPGALLAVRAAFEESIDLADGDLARRSGQQISTFRAPARFHEAALLQAGQNQLQEFLWDLLPSGNLGYLHRLARGLGAKIEDGLQGVFTFQRDV